MSAEPPDSLHDAVWFEVDRVGDLAGNARRTLLHGTIGGDLRGILGLGESAGIDATRDSPFAVSDPQASGVFGASALVWGRDHNPGLMESVELSSGEVSVLADVAEIVHVATSDPALSRLFYISVDVDDYVPTGLWMLPVGGTAIELPYDFPAQQVTNAMSYQLTANEDGSAVAVQQGEQGVVTVIEVAENRSVEFEPGGPVIGFASDLLITYGSLAPSGARDVISYDAATSNPRTLVRDVAAAQIIPGATDPILVTMRVDVNTAGYHILVTPLDGGETEIAYAHSGGGPMLARRDRSYLGYSLPRDWVLLTDSFIPFIDDPRVDGKDSPASSYPLAVNVRTGDTSQLGPFTAPPVD